MTEDERNAIYDQLDSARIDDWAAILWFSDHVSASAIGHPPRRIVYGPTLAQSLSRTLRPYRYTMYRKIGSQ